MPAGRIATSLVHTYCEPKAFAGLISEYGTGQYDTMNRTVGVSNGELEIISKGNRVAYQDSVKEEFSTECLFLPRLGYGALYL